MSSGLNTPMTPKRITNLDHLGGSYTGLQRRMSGPNSRLSAPIAKMPTGRIKRPYAKRSTLAKAGV